MGKIFKYRGKHAWMETSPNFNPVTQAIFRVDENEIAIDYLYLGKELGLKLKSEDGIIFKGTYELDNYEKGECSFIFYKNAKGCLLNGNYNSTRDGSGKWIIELEND